MNIKLADYNSDSKKATIELYEISADEIVELMADLQKMKIGKTQVKELDIELVNYNSKLKEATIEIHGIGAREIVLLLVELQKMKNIIKKESAKEEKPFQVQELPKIPEISQRLVHHLPEEPKIPKGPLEKIQEKEEVKDDVDKDLSNALDRSIKILREEEDSDKETDED